MPRSPGAFDDRAGYLFRLHAGGVDVGPLPLVAEAARPDERRRGPGALVVGFVAPAVVPRRTVSIGHCFAGLVAGEVLEVLRRGESRPLAAAATRVGHRGVLDVQAV